MENARWVVNEIICFYENGLLHSIFQRHNAASLQVLARFLKLYQLSVNLSEFILFTKRESKALFKCLE